MVKRSLTTALTILIVSFALTACDSTRHELAGGVKKESVASGDNEQAINGPFSFDAEWTTVTFDDPLKVDGNSVQVFGIALNPKDVQPRTLIDDNADQEGFSAKSPFGIKGWLPKRLEDGMIIKPQVELVTTEGEKIRLGVLGITEFGRGSYSPVSYNFGILPSSVEQSSNYQANFPQNHSYRAVRIRTNAPLEAYFLAWYVIPEDPSANK